MNIDRVIYWFVSIAFPDAVLGNDGGCVAVWSDACFERSSVYKSAMWNESTVDVTSPLFICDSWTDKGTWTMVHRCTCEFCESSHTPNTNVNTTTTTNRRKTHTLHLPESSSPDRWLTPFSPPPPVTSPSAAPTLYHRSNGASTRCVWCGASDRWSRPTCDSARWDNRRIQRSVWTDSAIRSSPFSISLPRFSMCCTDSGSDRVDTWCDHSTLQWIVAVVVVVVVVVVRACECVSLYVQ